MVQGVSGPTRRQIKRNAGTTAECEKMRIDRKEPSVFWPADSMYRALMADGT